MKRFTMSCVVAALMASSSAFAGALVLEVGNPETNPEAKALRALAVARVTACHEPAKSTVTATLVRLTNGKLERTKLNVIPLAEGGAFAILGSIPVAETTAIELAVTNPEYKNYEPRVIIRSDASGIQWASLKRFFGAPPSAADWKAVLE